MEKWGKKIVPWPVPYPGEINEYMSIKDIISGKTLQIMRSFGIPYNVIKDASKPMEVRETSIRKVIRDWMKDRKKEC